MRKARIQDIVYQWEREAGLERPRLPVLPDAEEQMRRLSFIEEEVLELKVAIANRDLVGVADALGDILWMTYGSAHAFGIDLDEIVREIAHSNYSKFPPRFNAAGKLVKGPGFFPPDLARVLADQLPL